MGKLNFPNIQTNANAQLSKPNPSWASKWFRKFQVCISNQFSISKFGQIRNEFENSNWLNSISIFETKLNIPKIQTKIMGSFNVMGRASMNIFSIFGNV